MKDIYLQKRCYLDWAATAIPHEYSGKYDQIFGNPSSQHTEGRKVKEALEGARCRCASVLGVKPEQLYFTSGGTESNILVLNSLLKKKWKGHLLYSAIEHPSIRENCLSLEKMGIASGIIGAEKDGRVTEAKISGTMEKFPDARFITVMKVNNETGSIMDLKALSSIIKAKSNSPVHFHSDMVQALGKVPIDLTGWNIDSASYSSHKLGGPFGIGLLYLKKPLEVLNFGGGQEGGIRPGTENTCGALKLADILEMRAKPEIVITESEKAAGRFKYLIGNLKKIKRCFLIPSDREEDDSRFSPWILQLRISGIPGAVLTRALDDEGVSISTGSACSSSSVERPVLSAMGIDEEGRLEGIRISQGWSTDFSDMDKFLSALKKVISSL